MPTHPRAQAQALLPWALMAIGFAAVYIASFIDLFNGISATDQQGHGRGPGFAPTGALAS